MICDVIVVGTLFLVNKIEIFDCFIFFPDKIQFILHSFEVPIEFSQEPSTISDRLKYCIGEKKKSTRNNMQ